MSASLGRILNEPIPVEQPKPRKPISKEHLRLMVNDNQWEKIGRMFHFTPKYHFGGRWIDWRSVPKSVMEILGKEPTNNQNPTNAQKFREGGISGFLYREQKGICHYCERHTTRAEWTIDHKTPKCRGGANQMFNFVGSCRTCNGLKSFMNHEEFMSLAPTEPGIEERCRQALKILEKRFQ